MAVLSDFSTLCRFILTSSILGGCLCPGLSWQNASTGCFGSDMSPKLSQLKDRNWKYLFQIWRRKPASRPFHHLHTLWGSFLRTLLLLLQGSGSHLRPLQALLQRLGLSLSCLWPWGSPSPSEAMVSWSWCLSRWVWMSLSVSHFLISLGNIYQVPLKMHLQGNIPPSPKRHFLLKSIYKNQMLATVL